MGFIYFLPGCNAPEVTDEVLAKYGLQHIKDAKDALLTRDVLRGIDGASGKMIGNSRLVDGADVKFDDTVQFKAFPKKHAELRAYCCWRKLPEPTQLARTRFLDGHVVECGGLQWTLPVARDISGAATCRLPVVYDQDEETGELNSVRIHRDYAKLWTHCEAYARASIDAIATATANGDQNTKFFINNPDEVICDAFQANYHVSLRELTILEVIETGTLKKVLDAVLDLQGIEELKKSPALDTGSTSAGAVQSSMELT